MDYRDHKTVVASGNIFLNDKKRGNFLKLYPVLEQNVGLLQEFRIVLNVNKVIEQGSLALLVLPGLRIIKSLFFIRILLDTPPPQ